MAYRSRTKGAAGVRKKRVLARGQNTTKVWITELNGALVKGAQGS